MAIKQSIRKHPTLFLALISAITTALVFIVVLIIFRQTPFGDNSLAINDARIQYLDFFAFLRRVLQGSDSLIFTFSKGLGGTALGLFGYYLASPLNILSLIITEDGLLLNILVVLKSALSSASFAIFLGYKFKKQLIRNDQPNTRKCLLLIILSISYGLSHYIAMQSSNIMWLDGVYMLPLMMLGVSKLVSEQRSTLLVIATGAAILFNWYTGAMNCIFIVGWFIFEVVFKYIENWNWREIWWIFLRFVLAMLLGVMIGAVILLPTMFALFGTAHGTPSLGSLFNVKFLGQLPTLISNYTIGRYSEYGAPSVFCGSVALIGAIMIFVSRKISAAKKYVFGGFVLFLVLCCYFVPFMTIFSLLEFVGSYWYRYGYILIASLLFMSAYYYFELSEERDSRRLLKAGILAAIVIVGVNFIVKPTVIDSSVVTTVWYSGILLCLISVLVGQMLKKQKSRLIVVSLSLLVLAELGLELAYFVNTADELQISNRVQYNNVTTQTLENIHNQDDSIYRISQTSVNRTGNNVFDENSNLAAKYNEGLALGYHSITTYTSTPDENQIQFLDKMGYADDYEIKTIVNTSIIPVDSILGVKYIMSEYPINGLKLTDLSPENSAKQVYQNPFALPMALVYRNNDLDMEYQGNPFEYQNQFYSKLLGRNINLYRKLDYQLVQQGIAGTGFTQQYQVKIPTGNYAVYGNIKASGMNPDMVLNVDNCYEVGYARANTTATGLLAPSVFYIPTDQNTKQVNLELSSSTSYNILEGSEQFYALDLNLLGKITDELMNYGNQPSMQMGKGGHVQITVDAESNQCLYLAIAADPGWTIIRNGETVEANLIANTFYSIPLVDGENIIELKYHAQGLLPGLMITATGLIGYVVVYFVEKRHSVKVRAV